MTMWLLVLQACYLNIWSLKMFAIVLLITRRKKNLLPASLDDYDELLHSHSHSHSHLIVDINPDRFEYLFETSKYCLLSSLYI